MNQFDSFLTALRWTEASCGLKPLVKATYCGMMEDVELWNLLEPVPGHPVGSTVSRRTLERLGFALPNRKLTDEEIATRKV